MVLINLINIFERILTHLLLSPNYKSETNEIWHLVLLFYVYGIFMGINIP